MPNEMTEEQKEDAKEKIKEQKEKINEKALITYNYFYLIRFFVKYSVRSLLRVYGSS